MKVTRRGFLQAAIVGIAAASIELRLSRAPVYLTDELRYTWESPNARYSYGIDKEKPWDVLIFDEKDGEYITPDELNERGKLEWFGKPVPARPLRPGEELAPVQPEGEETMQLRLPPEYAGSNTYGDDIDLAFGAYAAVVISQGYIGWEEEGKPGFSAPMKYIEEEVDAKIYTTSREFYASAEL